MKNHIEEIPRVITYLTEITFAQPLKNWLPNAHRITSTLNVFEEDVSVSLYFSVLFRKLGSETKTTLLPYQLLSQPAHPIGDKIGFGS